MFRFNNPEYLYGLFILLLPIALIAYQAWQKRKFVRRTIGSGHREVVLGSKSEIKDIVKSSSILLAFALALLSLARPQIGSRIEDVKQVGIDIIVCMDVSLSMKAEDLKPNRMEYAKRELLSLLKDLKGDRIGLIVFAGDAFVQIPLTNDYSAAGLFLNAIDVASVPVPGTAIAKALSLAVSSFEKESKTQKAVIILSDGEDHEGNVKEALAETADNQIKVFTIGIGSPLGTPIPVYDSNGLQLGFKTDESGKTVLSAVNEDMLKDIAARGGGKYYLANQSGDELEAIHAELGGLEKSEFGVKKITEYDEKYYYFLFPAILLLIFEFFLSDVKSRFFASILQKLNVSRK